MALVPPVQSRSGDSGAAANATLAFLSNNTAGNFLICAHSIQGANTGDRATDSRNTYSHDVLDLQDTNVTVDVTACIESVANCGAGANTITVTGGGSQSRNVHIFEYANILTSSPFDKTANNNNFGTALDSGLTATLSQPSELVFAFGACGGSAESPFTAGSSLTIRQDLAGGSMDSVTADLEVSATTAVKATFTGTSSNGWICVVATYKAAPPADTGRLQSLGPKKGPSDRRGFTAFKGATDVPTPAGYGGIMWIIA